MSAERTDFKRHGQMPGGDAGSPQRWTSWFQSRLSGRVMSGMELNPLRPRSLHHKASETGLNKLVMMGPVAPRPA